MRNEAERCKEPRRYSGQGEEKDKNMHNITLVNTYHAERGNCNLYELYKIIETIKFIDDESLMPINQQWLDFMSNREDVMISKIYDYCKEHNFERGLFYIGAAHRSAIIEKTQKYNETAEIKLSWNYLDFGDILQW